MEPFTEVLPSRSLGSKGRPVRRWPDELKAQIVSETLENGVKVVDVARRYDLNPARISEWRRLALDGALTLPASNTTMHFVPMQVAEPVDPAGSACLELVCGQITLRLPASYATGQIVELVHGLNDRP